ncbi:hypothetical protein TNCV_3661121 [Trichonephila clavipes]|nr:hypothetical protein TNCV_3661121 [Trichonephila clavipes]
MSVQVSLQRNTKAIGDGSRNFEPRSSDDDGLPLPHHANKRTSSHNRFNVHPLPPMNGASSVALGNLLLILHMPRPWIPLPHRYCS